MAVAMSRSVIRTVPAASRQYPGAVTSTLRTRLLSAAAASTLLLALAACTSAPSEESAPTDGAADSGECSGVTVIVDTGDLEGADDTEVETCVDAEATIGAADALAEAGVTTEGTDEFGDQVVCRVNGTPAEDLVLTAEDGSDYTETCESMPAAFAYWSMWVQPAGGDWAYAQEGLATLELEPGDSLQLLFTLDGEPAEPTS